MKTKALTSMCLAAWLGLLSNVPAIAVGKVQLLKCDGATVDFAQSSDFRGIGFGKSSSFARIRSDRRTVGLEVSGLPAETLVKVEIYFRHNGATVSKANPGGLIGAFCFNDPSTKESYHQWLYFKDVKAARSNPDPRKILYSAEFYDTDFDFKHIPRSAVLSSFQILAFPDHSYLELDIGYINVWTFSGKDIEIAEPNNLILFQTLGCDSVFRCEYTLDSRNPELKKRVKERRQILQERGQIRR